MAKSKNPLEKIKKITNALDTLYSKKSATAIREFLKAQKIVGAVGDGDSCPIANYLRRETGEDDVDVTGSRVRVNGVEVDGNGPINTFVANFDKRKYKELIESED